MMLICSLLLALPGVAAPSDDLLDPAHLAGLSKEDSKEDFDPIASMLRVQYISRAMLKGHEWIERDEDQKRGYLIGYMDGMFNAATYYIPTEEKRAAAIQSLPMSQGAAIGQLVQEVDQFYADAKNRTIPISFALVAIRNLRAAIGRTPEHERQLDEYIASLQEMFRDAPAEVVDDP